MKRCHRSRSLLFAAPLWLVSAIAGFAASPAPAGHPIPIAEARKLAPGASVTIDGSVSTPSGAFEPSFSDKGFGLQDASAGIYVSTPANLDVAPGKHARVSGVLKDQSGLLVVVPAGAAGVKVHGDGPKIEPQRVKTAAIGEATEGRIVQVLGKISQAPASDAHYGFNFSVDDGSGIGMNGLVLGQPVSVTGFSSQYDTHYEIDPRSVDDIAAQAP